jgi:hypothetical protein
LVGEGGVGGDKSVGAGGGEIAGAVGGKGAIVGVFTGVKGAACNGGIAAASKVQLASVAATQPRTYALQLF